MIRSVKNSRMRYTAEKRRSGFTLLEMLVVIGVISILAAMTVGVIRIAKTSSTEKRIEGQLNKLITAIEQYKSKTGFYPPDHQTKTLSGQIRYTQYGKPIVNPVLNPLFYELNGVVVDLATQSYLANGDPAEYALNGNQVVSWFGMSGFQNSAKDPASLKSSFDGFKQSDLVQVDGAIINAAPKPQGRVTLLSVPSPWPRQFQDRNPLGNTSLNVWYYNSSNPTNNPAAFDLWAEMPFVNESGQYEVKRIGNWKTE